MRPPRSGFERCAWQRQKNSDDRARLQRAIWLCRNGDYSEFFLLRSEFDVGCHNPERYGVTKSELYVWRQAANEAAAKGEATGD